MSAGIVMNSATHSRPKLFKTRDDWAAWLDENHRESTGLWLQIAKKGAGLQTVTYGEAVEVALCYGWIDGVRYAVDRGSYKIRFTPRKTKSIWSLVNVRNVERLKKHGRMAEPGLLAFAAREQQRTGIYAFEQKRAGLSREQKKIFRRNAAGWSFFSSQAPWYQRTAGYWVSSAKQTETQQRRLARLMKDSEAGRRIDRLTPKAKRTTPKS